MNAKQYLMRARWLRDQIDRIGDKIFRLREEMTSTGAIRYDKISVQSTPEGDPLLKYITRLTDAEEKLVRLQAEYYEAYTTIAKQIDSIEPELFRQILSLRYLEDMTLHQIADRLRYSYEYIRNRHGAALKKFAEVVVFC